MACAELDLSTFAAARAGAWFPELAGHARRIDIVPVRAHAGVRVDRLVIASAGGSREVIAKQYNDDGTRPPERARLGLPDDRVYKPECEYRGLEALRRAVDAVAPPHDRVAAVRPLEFDPDLRLLIMEAFPGRDGRAFVSRSQKGAIDAFRAGGGALAIAHSISVPGSDRRSSWGEVDLAFESLHGFIASRKRRWPAAELQAWWRRPHADATIVLGAGHVDCAPRNLLVDEQRRIAWIDGLFRYRIPVYEDVAVFTTSVRLSARVRPGRNAFLRQEGHRLAQAFLDGYQRRARLDMSLLPRFEVLTLLDRISALQTGASSARSSLIEWACTRELTRVMQETP